MVNESLKVWGQWRVEMRLWKTKIKREDIERNQTAGGWWEAPAAIPTSLSFFYWPLSLSIYLFFAPSISASQSRSRHCALWLGCQRVCVCVCVCMCVCVCLGMCGRAWDDNQCANACAACWVSVCPFVPARPRCKANKNQAARLSWVHPANTQKNPQSST